MIRFLPNSLKGFDQMVGVELKIQADGYSITAVVLEQKKGKVNLVKHQSGITQVSDLKVFVDENMPVALCISGKGILHKKIENKSESDIQKTLFQVIPNAKATDFYLQLGGPKLSIARKQIIDNLLKEFKENDLSVISLSFGGLVLELLFPLIDLRGLDSLQIVDHKYLISNGEIKRYNNQGAEENSVESLNIGDEKIQANNVIAYATAFQQFLSEQIYSKVELIDFQKEEFVHKKVFTKLGWGVLGFFMIVLLANFVSFSFLSSSTDKLMVASSLHQSQLERLDKLQKEVGEKDRFFQNEGWLQSSKASFYADRIAATVPTSVLLKTLAVNPLNEKETRDLRKQMFDDGFIVIAGSCKRPIDLNGWIKRLKDFAWAKKVNVETYQFDSGEKAGNFKLEVQF